jgi:mono/diheme cytochrome c family protein
MRASALATTLLLSGCCFSNPGGAGCKLDDSSAGEAALAVGTVDPNASTLFKPAQAVLRNNCVQCHTAFGSYSEAEWLSSGYVTAGDPANSPIFTRLRNAGAGGTENMPPAGALPASDRTAVKNWISGLSTGSSSGSATRLAAAITALGRTYPNSGKSCLNCHSVQRTATSGAYGGATVPAFGTFTTSNQFVTSGLVVDGNPSLSWLFRALRTHGDIGSMPAGESVSMSVQDAATISDWITNLSNP